jgi:hypothetical protein
MVLSFGCGLHWWGSRDEASIECSHEKKYTNGKKKSSGKKKKKKKILAREGRREMEKLFKDPHCGILKTMKK